MERGITFGARRAGITRFLSVFFTVLTVFFAAAATGQATDNPGESISTKPVPAGDFFIRWKHGTPPSAMTEYYQQAGVKPVWRSSLVWGLERVAPVAPRVQGFMAAMSMLQGSPHIIYAEPNYRIHRKIFPMQSHSTKGLLPLEKQGPNDPLFKKQWALSASPGLKVEQAWAVTRGNSNVKVAVIDTGVDADHDEMKGKVAPGYDFIDKTAEVRDHHGHGTHVSGIIGANTNNGIGIAGISPEVTIIPIRAVPSDADETDADVIASFELAVKAGARVANCSFGKSKSAQAVGDTIAAAGDHGLLAVVAAGNSSEDLNRGKSYPASFQTKNMIVVAATSSNGRMASFSNYGNGKVDIAAPGAGIVSSVTNNGYDSWSGTSMAAPQVAGVAALVTAVNPELTPEQVKEIILRTAEPNPSLKGKVTTGAQLDAAAAVAATVKLQERYRIW